MNPDFTLPITDLDVILSLIPHRPPFVMVDRLLEYAEGRLLTGFLITKENVLLENDLFLEACLIENMAQSVALQGGYCGYLSGGKAAEIGFLGALNKVEIFSSPSVGTILQTEVKTVYEAMGITLSEIEVSDSSQKILARAAIKTVVGK